MRSYRHNRDFSRNVEPELCELCAELAARYVLHIYYASGLNVDQGLCLVCLPTRCYQLESMGIEYRLGGQISFPSDES